MPEPWGHFFNSHYLAFFPRPFLNLSTSHSVCVPQAWRTQTLTTHIKTHIYAGLHQCVSTSSFSPCFLCSRQISLALISCRVSLETAYCSLSMRSTAAAHADLPNFLWSARILSYSAAINVQKKMCKSDILAKCTSASTLESDKQSLFWAI